MSTTSELGEDNGGRPPKRSAAGMGIWVGVFVTYVLSPIPVAFLFMKAGRFDLWPRVATVIYMPILWLAKRFDVVEKFYEWQARLIGLN